jgi:hypothetical protein
LVRYVRSCPKARRSDCPLSANRVRCTAKEKTATRRSFPATISIAIRLRVQQRSSVSCAELANDRAAADGEDHGRAGLDSDARSFQFGLASAPTAPADYSNITPSRVRSTHTTLQYRSRWSPSSVNQKDCGKPKVLPTLRPAPCDVRSRIVQGSSVPFGPNLIIPRRCCVERRASRLRSIACLIKSCSAMMSLQ